LVFVCLVLILCDGKEFNKSGLLEYGWITGIGKKFSPSLGDRSPHMQMTTYISNILSFYNQTWDIDICCIC
jgi:hypothetical protein